MKFYKILSKDLFTSNQYQVITASHYDQPSYGDLDLHPTDNDPTTNIIKPGREFLNAEI